VSHGDGQLGRSELAQQLKDALADARGIRVNEVCFVVTDSRLRDTSLAAQLAAAALGEEQDQFRKMLNDPQKLLELIAAAEGRKSGSDMASLTAGVDGSGAGGNGSGNGDEGGNGTGDGFAGGNGIGAMNGPTGGLGSTMRSAAGPGYGPGGGSGRGGNGSGEPSEEDIYGILHALSTFGQMGTTQNPTVAALEFQGQVTQMPSRAQDTLRNALAGLAEEGKNKKLDQAVLVQLAEHLSIRFALEKFESGEAKVNAVRQMLDRMNHEIEELRKILGQHEDKMAEAGILVESHREILDRHFWASVPDNAKRQVLLSEEAWCIPPKNVQSYVLGLIVHGDTPEAIGILQNYARCTDSEEPEARKRAVTGLSELAGLYAQADPEAAGPCAPPCWPAT